ncbi:hypothetical protein ASPVEDRAFT_375570 [Aspergillus versicolor CBS 583.65]|uniref:Uncharacterized protein n=1 Tax=Aspergillus versicolor CBS 583.65 TaxID=1036611 RepID=A0A1L9Q231_ASPVE|nr:uncharacterized protein ASPVEDRAFT_375570 [Aspergillus versicolor CBS 583.65]OJJ07824.1 hypothetical protein ASPVEDRAFT_375570 [Aspergillus versicolor CBS 583.65]
MKRNTVAVNPPLECALCPSPTRSWDEFFECLCRHCLVLKADHADEGYSERDDGEEGELVKRDFSHNASSVHRN